MSTIAEKARAEAEAAEAEHPDEEAEDETPAEGDEPAIGDEPELEPEAEPQGRKGKSPQEKFQAAFAVFVKKAAECFEVTPADVEIAPHPGVVGIVLPGFTVPRTHPDFKRCEVCNGLGKVLTDATTGDPTKDWTTCPDMRCKGNGYWKKQGAPEQVVTTGPLAQPAAVNDGGEWAEAPAWMGDPNLTPGQ